MGAAHGLSARSGDQWVPSIHFHMEMRGQADTEGARERWRVYVKEKGEELQHISRHDSRKTERRRGAAEMKAEEKQ